MVSQNTVKFILIKDWWSQSIRSTLSRVRKKGLHQVKWSSYRRSLSRFPKHEATRSILHSPLDGMLVHCRVTPSIKVASTHLYTWVERGTMRVKCLGKEHNAMSPARAWTRTAQSGVERTNHEATVPVHIRLHNHLTTELHIFHNLVLTFPTDWSRAVAIAANILRFSSWMLFVNLLIRFWGASSRSCESALWTASWAKYRNNGLEVSCVLIRFTAWSVKRYVR